MKKIILALTILAIAVPAVADTVTVTAVDEGEGVVALSYAVVPGPNLPRAFALDITVDAGTIDSVDTTGAQPFDIYMGTIDVNQSTGVIDSNGTPVAPGTAPGAKAGLGTDGITIEMGSLYEKGVEPDPCASGLLIKVTVSDNCTLSLAENTTRGGIVMEDVSITPTVVLNGTAVVKGCFPPAHADYAEWQAVGEPDCWCYPRQCYGDADGIKQGSAIMGFYYVGSNDLNILVPAYMVKEPPKGPGISTITDGICADFARDKQGSAIMGFYRVGSNDLNILVGNYMVKEPPKGPGLATDCGGTLVP